MLQRRRAPFSLAPTFLGTGFPPPKAPGYPKTLRNHTASLPQIPRQLPVPHPNHQKATPRPTTPGIPQKRSPRTKDAPIINYFGVCTFFPTVCCVFPAREKLKKFGVCTPRPRWAFVRGSSAPVSKREICGITWALFCPHCFCHPGAEHKPSRLAPGKG